MARWSPGDIVVVLGAGATRGAEFVEKHDPACLPPLNADFFTQLQRVRSKKHQDVVAGVLSDVLQIYGPNYQVTLEQYVTQLESLAGMLAMLPAHGQDLTPQRVGDMRKRLLNGLSAVLEESADVAKATSVARKEPCQYHRAIAEKLARRDTIISFNYDCVMDDALRQFACGKWSARYGYGFPQPSRVTGHEVWSNSPSPDKQNASINLLKLHGSLNWRPLPVDQSEEIRLRERPYKQNGDQEYELVPPETSKRLDDRPTLQNLWASAELALRRSSVLALVGFSFTPNDLHVDSLFRLALGSNRDLRKVVIVNPSPRDRQAVRTVLARQLGQDIRLVQFERLRDFARHIDVLSD